MSVVARWATPHDAEAIWRVQIESRATLGDAMSAEEHRRLMAEDRRANRWPVRLSQRELVLVAEADGRLVGYCSIARARPEPPGWAGEIYELYVLPDSQRRGVGRTLVLAAAASLRRLGMRSMSVWALATNWPSRRFYEAMGAELVDERKLTDSVAEWPIAVYGWRDVDALLQSARHATPEAFHEAHRAAWRLGKRRREHVQRDLRIGLGIVLLLVAASVAGDWALATAVARQVAVALAIAGMALLLSASSWRRWVRR